MITQRAARTIPEGGWQRITSLNTGSGSAWEKQIRRLLAVMRDFREVVSVVKTVKMVLVPLILLALSVSPLLCAEREIVAQSEKDLDLDGCTETVAVEMASGERIVETEPGPFAGERLEGFFELVVRTAEGEEKSLLLNPLFFPEYPDEPMVFTDRQWEMFFADYNADGFPDCNLGQYAGSNGNVYIIVAFLPSGQPYVLPFEGRPGGVFAADRAFSSGVVEPLSGGVAFVEVSGVQLGYVPTRDIFPVPHDSRNFGFHSSQAAIGNAASP